MCVRFSATLLQWNCSPQTRLSISSCCVRLPTTPSVREWYGGSRLGCRCFLSFHFTGSMTSQSRVRTLLCQRNIPQNCSECCMTDFRPHERRHHRRSEERRVGKEGS